MSKSFKEKLQRAQPAGAKLKSGIGAAILAKYGWKEGEGLGKTKDGIREPVKLKKIDGDKGLGEKEYDPWHNWWDDLYNHTARKSKAVVAINTAQGQTDVESSVNGETSHESSGGASDSSEDDSSSSSDDNASVSSDNDSSPDGDSPSSDGSTSSSEGTPLTVTRVGPELKNGTKKHKRKQSELAEERKQKQIKGRIGSEKEDGSISGPSMLPSSSSSSSSSDEPKAKVKKTKKSDAVKKKKLGTVR